ncbi:ribosomal subunit interface protein [Candidatus Nomurabacteria bacterium CG1_02_43_90]|uniref:Ribosomal subunit interface protein n=1 Tax=Candidatus Nomurabacteria bacterium CG1_02_43_90 TaxID=1805281 RepID=A0A1J4V8X7_9BACT|nr:MAG: ribosomal subunit interface protein [Candidatus Nomurabacteria bacterium CG1_02_43_90]
MKINIKTTNMEGTAALSSYVEEKLQSVEKFTLPHESEDVVAEVEIGKINNHHQSGDVFRAEVNLRVRGKSFRATSEKSDLYAAIDDMRNELVREITSHKDKARTIVRRGGGILKKMLRFGSK